MEFKIERKEFQEQINKVSRAITGKLGNPILDGVCIVAENGALKLTGSDSNLTIVTTTEAQVIEAGSIVVESRILSEIIRRLPDDEVHIKTSDAVIQIRCQKSDFTIGYTSGAEYPSIELDTDGDEMSINQGVIKDMVKCVSFASLNDDTRPILKGILFEATTEKLNMVALDGYRLAKKSIDINIEKEMKPVVDAKNMIEITRLMNDLDGDVTIKVTPNHIVFSFENTIVMSRLLDGNFVKYNTLIPTEFSSKIKVSREELIGSLERASLMSENGNKLAKLTIVGDSMNISARSQLGQVTEDLQIEADGDVNLTIAFNTKYLLEALRALTDSEVILNMNNPVSPCVIRGTEDSGSEHLVLPVRLI